MTIPSNVTKVLKELHSHGHEAFIVGGCVRDMILDISPYDYDITTSAEPEEVKAIFNKTIDTGIEHGTVTVMMNSEGYEVTTYRIDGKYLDNRRPSTVDFTKSLEEDLKRRDFTINAMAYNEEQGVVDLFNGQEDLKLGIVRCVGEAQQRFREDALRMLRAVRFAARFGFEIEDSTAEAIGELAPLIKNISEERIHMELTKTLCSDNPYYMKRLHEYGILTHILPEFVPCIGMSQNHPYHRFDVDEHTYECLKHTPSDEGLRWAVYLHDVGKGYTKTTDDQGIDHFKGHAALSQSMADAILKRLKFDNKTRKRVTTLIGYHDYRFDTSLKGVRRAMAKMGPELFEDYLAVQRADIKGQAFSKMASRLEEMDKKEALYQQILVQNQCVTVADLKVDGRDMIALGAKGKGIGVLLSHLLERVLEEPDYNEASWLLDEAKRYMGENSHNEQS